MKATDRLLKICDDIIPILLLLETCKGHSRTWDVLCTRIRGVSFASRWGAYLFRVGKVVEKRGLTPDNSLLLVCLGVFETCRLTSLSTEQTLPRHEHQHAHAHKTHGNGVPMKVRSDFVAFTRADCMALGTTRLEKLSTALSVTYDGSSTRMSFRKVYMVVSVTRSVRHWY